MSFLDPTGPALTRRGLFAALPAAASFDIRQFGANPAPGSDNAPPIQAALDKAASLGGGTVIIPPGLWLASALNLPSNTTLDLQPGAILQSAEAEKLFQTGRLAQRFLLTAKQASNVTIRGEGEIRGTGADDYGWRWGIPMTRKHRSSLIHFVDCSNIRLLDVTLRYSESYTVVLENCRSAIIRGIDLLNSTRHENTDAIDLFSSSDIRISDCRIVAGDDAIVLKTPDGGACERILVSNCVLQSSCSAMKLGTGSAGVFRDIHFANISATHGELGIALFMKDGGLIEGVSFSNIHIGYALPPSKYPTLEDARRDPVVAPILDGRSATFDRYNIWLNLAEIPIFIDLNRRRNAPFGRIRDVTFSDLRIQSRTGILIQGRPGHPLENLRFDGIAFRTAETVPYDNRHISPGGEQDLHDEHDTLHARQPSWFTAAFIDGLCVRDYCLHLDGAASLPARSALHLHSVSGACLDRVRRYGGSSSLKPLRLYQCPEADLSRVASSEIEQLG